MKKAGWNLRQGGFLDAAARAGSMGLHLFSGMLVGALAGYFLDKHLGTGPWLKLVFFVLGLGAGARNLYLDARLLLRDQEKRDAGELEEGD